MSLLRDRLMHHHSRRTMHKLFKRDWIVRMIWPGVIGTAVRKKRNYDKRLSGRPFVIRNSVWLHNVPRKKGRNAKLDCPWEGPYLVISVLSGCGVPYSEEPKGQAHGHSLRQIKALPGSPTGEMNSEKADAVIEPKRGGETDIGCGFKLCRRGTVSSG